MSSQQTMDESMYREQQPSFPQQQQQQQIPIQKQTNSIWPEKLSRKSHVDQKQPNQNRKKVQQEDSDYSEDDYVDSDSQPDNEEITTTTEAPKKVNFIYFSPHSHLLP